MIILAIIDMGRSIIFPAFLFRVGTDGCVALLLDLLPHFILPDDPYLLLVLHPFHLDDLLFLR
jgi:hypothetical protein